MARHFLEWQWQLPFLAAMGPCVWDYFKFSAKLDMMSFYSTIHEEYFNFILIHFKRFFFFFTHLLTCSFRNCVCSTYKHYLNLTLHHRQHQQCYHPKHSPAVLYNGPCLHFVCYTENMGILFPLAPHYSATNQKYEECVTRCSGLNTMLLLSSHSHPYPAALIMCCFLDRPCLPPQWRFCFV